MGVITMEEMENVFVLEREREYRSMRTIVRRGLEETGWAGSDCSRPVAPPKRSKEQHFLMTLMKGLS